MFVKNMKGKETQIPSSEDLQKWEILCFKRLKTFVPSKLHKEFIEVLDDYLEVVMDLEKRCGE